MREGIIVFLLILLVFGGVLTCIYVGIRMEESITKYATIKVAKVTTWKAPLTRWKRTSVISYDGSELTFWGDLSDTFQAEGVYEISYRVKYRLGIMAANNLLSCQQIEEEFE